MSDSLPTFDPWVPMEYQNSDFDCSQESAQFLLRCWGRSPDDAWMTQEWLDQGIMTAEDGLMDATGAGMADWLNRTYGEDGYEASNNASVSFDDIAAEVAPGKHPAAAGGRSYCHWIGIRAFDGEVLQIHNSAPGYMGVGQTLSRAQFASLGPWSMVRLTHPAAEGAVPVDEIDYTPWEPYIGSGILSMMAVDQAEPAAPSTWLPLGSAQAAIEEAMATDGRVYRWVLAESRGFRYAPT